MALYIHVLYMALYIHVLYMAYMYYTWYSRYAACQKKTSYRQLPRTIIKVFPRQDACVMNK